ncbi:MAG: excisionase family DNA-binding protein [Calditrichia bacterium]
MIKEKVKYFNSVEAAEILGVNVSTIKRWTESGKLKCIKTAGGHRKFLMEHLIDFVEHHKKKADQVSIFPIESAKDVELSFHVVKRNYPYLIQYTLDNAFEGNRHNIQVVLNGLYLAQVPLHEMYDQLLSPVLVKVGELWADGTMSISMEHLATQAIKDAIIQLQGILNIPSEKTGTALCLNMSGELHDIPLKMIDHILEVRGYKTLFTGQITPSLRLNEIFEKFHPERVYISSTYIVEIEETREELSRICDLAMSFDAEVYTSGPGFLQLKPNHPAIKKHLNTFEEVALI